MEPKKSLGQNFFVNQNLAKRIVQEVFNESPELIAEIGPGQGYFSKIFYEQKAKLLLVEKDDNLAEQLSSIFPKEIVINKDFLDWDFEELSIFPKDKITFFGSLPYNVSKKIIDKIINSEYFRNPCFFIIQKEVAERVCAKSPDANYLSIFLQTFFNVELISVVPKEHFYPSPQVDGAIISLHKNSNLACVGGDDRCGVWIALQIMDDIISGRLPKNSYSIGFFCDEERGGKGSGEYVLDLLDDEVNYTTAYIGLDRRNATIGVPEFATYGCDNKTLNNIVSSHYIEKMGSFTDASNISEETNIACINLSIGYNNEHTVNEYINTEDTEFTLEYLRCLPFGNEVYNYIKYPKDKWWDNYHSIDDKWSFKAENTKVLCQYCGEHLPLYDCCDEYGGSIMLCETCKDFIY